MAKFRVSVHEVRDSSAERKYVIKKQKNREWRKMGN